MSVNKTGYHCNNLYKFFIALNCKQAWKHHLTAKIGLFGFCFFN